MCTLPTFVTNDQAFFRRSYVEFSAQTSRWLQQSLPSRSASSSLFWHHVFTVSEIPRNEYQCIIRGHKNGSASVCALWQIVEGLLWSLIAIIAMESYNSKGTFNLKGDAISYVELSWKLFVKQNLWYCIWIIRSSSFYYTLVKLPSLEHWSLPH